MANIKILNKAYQFGGATPYGNTTTLQFGYATNAAGIVVDSDSKVAVKSGDKIFLGTLPEGFVLTEVYGGTLGFEYVDGQNSTVVPQTANVATGALLKRLPKDAYVYFTATADIATATTGRFAIQGILEGRS